MGKRSRAARHPWSRRRLSGDAASGDSEPAPGAHTECRRSAGAREMLEYDGGGELVDPRLRWADPRIRRRSRPATTLTATRSRVGAVA